MKFLKFKPCFNKISHLLLKFQNTPGHSIYLIDKSGDVCACSISYYYLFRVKCNEKIGIFEVFIC